MPSYDQARMTADEARQALDTLGLTREQAARLLRITDRTLRRYLEDDSEEGGGIPGPVEQALLAWLALNERGLPWRPDALPLNTFLPEHLARLNMLRQHVLECVERVDGRGGSNLPWDIDEQRGVAKLGTMSLYFYVLPSGGFVPQGYARSDKAPDLERDKSHLEDGIAAIAQWLKTIELPVEPPPMLIKAVHRNKAFELWDDHAPPRYLVRIKEEVAAALAQTATWEDDWEVACSRFLAASQDEIAKIAEREIFRKRSVHLELAGIDLVELDAEALAPAGVHRRRVRVEVPIRRRLKTERVRAIDAPADGMPKKLTEDGETL